MRGLTRMDHNAGIFGKGGFTMVNKLWHAQKGIPKHKISKKGTEAISLALSLSYTHTHTHTHTHRMKGKELTRRVGDTGSWRVSAGNLLSVRHLQ